MKIDIFIIMIQEENVTYILLACNHQLAKDLLLVVVRVVVYGTSYQIILN